MNPPRKPTPLGVPVPPKRPGDSLPPEERMARQVLLAVQSLTAKVDAAEAERTSERGRDLQRFADMDDRLVAVERQVVEHHESRLMYMETARDTSRKIDQLSDHVLGLVKTDATHERDIGAVKLQVAELAKVSGKLAGGQEGAQKGKQWGAFSAVVVAVLAAAVRWALGKLGIEI